MNEEQEKQLNGGENKDIIVKGSPEIDASLIDLISNRLVRYTCQFFAKRKEGMRPFGSGVFVQIHGVHIILTASHVAEWISEDKDLFIKVDEKTYVNVLGEIKLTDINKSQGVDLAYIKLDKQLIEPLSKPYLFLTIDKIRSHAKLVNAMHYCIIGFPENLIKRENGLLKTGATAYLSSPADEKPYDYYNYKKEDNIIVTIRGKGTDIFTGKPTKVNTHFHGISGCGLWYLMYKYNEEPMFYSVDYRLIGIMTEYKKGKYFCLIGYKIHLILQALEIIEKMKFKEVPRK